MLVELVCPKGAIVRLCSGRRFAVMTDEGTVRELLGIGAQPAPICRELHSEMLALALEAQTRDELAASPRG